ATLSGQAVALEAQVLAASSIVLHASSERTMSGYALLRDVYDQPTLVLSVDLPRDIYQHGQLSFRSLTTVLALGSVILVVAILLLVELTVLSRTESLRRQVKAAGEAGDPSRRVSLPGTDELSDLAEDINTMLSGLERSEESLRRRQQYLQAIGRVAQALLTSAGDIPYESVLQTLGQAAQASRATLFLRGRYLGKEPTAHRIAQWHTAGLNGELTLPYEVDQRLPRWVEVLQQGQLLHGRVSDLPAPERATLEAQGTQVFLALPLVVGEDLLGAMIFERHGEALDWEADEVEMLRVAAADLAQALERQRRERLQHATFRIAETVQRVQNLHEFFPALHQIVATLMPAQNLYITLYDPRQDVLQFPYYVDEHDTPPPPSPLGRGLTEYVLRTGEPLLASPEVYADLVQRGDIEVVGAPAVDWLGVPLKVHDQSIGVLAVQSYTEGVRYRQAEKDILQFVSTQVAMAIEHMRIEDALRESEDRYRTIFQTTGTATAILEEDTSIFLANDTMEKLTGYSAGELIGRSWTEFVHPDDLPRMQEYNRLRRVNARAAPSSYEFRFQNRWGEGRDVLVTAAILPGGKQTVASVLDISERKRMENELRQLKEFNEGIVKGVAEGLLIEDERGTITFANPALENLLGYGAGELVGCHWQQIVPAEDWASVQIQTDRRPAALGGQYESRLLRKDGQPVWVWVSARPLFRERTYAGVLSAFTDISTLKETEQSLRESEARYRRHFEDSPLSLWEEDLSEVKRQIEGWRESGMGDLHTYFEQHPQAVSDLLARVRVIDVNRATLKLFQARSKVELQRGLSAVVGGSIDPAIRRHFVAISEGATRFSAEVVNWTLAGERKVLELTWEVFPGYEDTLSRCVVSLVDLTERQRTEAERAELEAQLRQSQKMEAVGLLAGGVAHEFNNLLTVIQGNVELALSQVGADAVVAKGLSAAHKAARRGAVLTERLLVFGRRQAAGRVALDVNRVVADFAEMVHRVIGVDIEFHLELADGLKPALADAGAVEQVLLNLVLNARDAMPQGGLLSLATAAVTLDAAYCHTHAGVHEGEYVRLTVTDTGQGINEEAREHLFEPFFSTKEVGKGTGLGLSVVYGLVKQHQGSIDVQSTPGQGTRFDIYLPVAQQPS
ncbi:MAG: PAS domain S-box protein, partial [Chloroflexi bacterium]|nr:PAS domain S-box protein [Chloroflexota bacterium]